jgi:membrane protein DedA with SNARE-associated domain
LKSITHALAKFGLKISALLMPLGVWGVLAIATLDGVGVPMPGVLDIAFAKYIHNQPHLAWLYVLVAAVGSTLGCLVLYFIGYEGAEVVLRKRMSPEKFERTRLSFEKNRVWALMLPAMLPPPFPFKVFVLAAAVFEMEVKHFLVAIFAGRLIRFAALAALVVFLGPDIKVIGVFLRRHLWVLAAVACVAVVIWLLVRRARRNKNSPELTGVGK